MGRKIGNIGVLNLLHATEESISDIESIANVGLLISTPESTKLLARMNISNVGKSIELPQGYRLITGQFEITEKFLEQLETSGEPAHYAVTGTVLIHRSVTAEQLQRTRLAVQTVGIAYVPKHLHGAVESVVEANKLVLYDGAPPRTEAGTFVLSNAYLNSLEEPTSLIVAGTFILPEDLDLTLADRMLKELTVAGTARLREGQSAFFYRKSDSLAGCRVEIIPDGFQQLDRLLKLNQRSLRRFRKAKVYTRSPILLDADVTREALAAAFERIDSNSYVVCSEELEDLVYELCPSLEAEVLTYPHSYLYIEDQETLSEAELNALPAPVQVVVEGSLTFAEDVQSETLAAKVSGLDSFGSVTVPNARFKGWLQPYIRTQQGYVQVPSDSAGDGYLNNIGVLTL
ncbi:hypothetical protein [Gorillibacterium sp. sgz500922]|uniref:hypothetical protein n=1 Tax=Gorillibacterium sp. sgz500922 TaxID=3446694 RepID=UPI003F66F6F1